MNSDEETPSCANSSLTSISSISEANNKNEKALVKYLPQSMDYDVCMAEIQKSPVAHSLETKILPVRRYRKKCPYQTIFQEQTLSTLQTIHEDKIWLFKKEPPLPGSTSTICNEYAVAVSPINKSRYLCEAVSQNDISFVKKLIEYAHASPNCFDSHRRTPLHIAVSKGNLEMAKYLLEKGADPNVKDGLSNSCLHLATCTHNVAMALLLIKGGASVHAVDIQGRSPIQLAQSRLRILQRCPDGFIKSKVKQIIDMLLMYFQAGSEHRNNDEESSLLSSFQTKLQITESPQQITSEIDNLSRLLDKMGNLTL